MTVFVSSSTSVNRHGAFAIEQNPPAAITPIGTGVACLTAQFPWGRTKVIVEPPTDADLRNEIAPPGFDRTGSGYLSIIQKAFPTLKFVRVEGTGAVKAKATLIETGPTSIVDVEGKFVGAGGNSIIATVKLASDGDPNHFDLDVSITGASGTTTDSFQNLNYSGVGANSTPDFSNTLLVGAINFLAAGIPDVGASNFTGGVDGTVAAIDYTGTPTTADQGIAVMEGDKTIRHIFVDDPGNTLRAAVNAALQAHAELQGDRVSYINGDNGLSLTSTRTDVANYRSDRAVYIDPWARIRDEVTGVLRDVPPGSFGASVGSQLSPSTSIGWKNAEVQRMLAGITELVSPRGEGAGGNTDQGIATLILEEEGGKTFEAGVVALAPVDNTKRNLTRRRMADFIAVSFVRSVRGIVDAPNVGVFQQSLVNALDRLLRGLKRAQFGDAAHIPHILDYKILPLNSANTRNDLDAGKFFIPVQVKTSSALEQIFLTIQIGETVTVEAA